jgi:hypothetical protein
VGHQVFNIIPTISVVYVIIHAIYLILAFNPEKLTNQLPVMKRHAGPTASLIAAAATPVRGLRKVTGTSKSMILVPLSI